MSETAIFVIGLGASLLCGFFVVFSFFELRKAGQESERAYRRRDTDKP